MLKRPKPSDSEKDILQFQNEYLSEKRQNASFQPSAKCVRVGESSSTSSDSGKKQSLFARSRNKETQDKSAESDNKPNAFVLGDIVERHPESQSGARSDEPMVEESFPKTEKIDIHTKSVGKSIFAKLQEKKAKNTSPESSKTEKIPCFGEKSYIVTGSESSTIHEENIRTLSQMSKEEIEEEREKLMRTIDPKLLDFIRSKRQKPEPMEVDEISVPSTSAESKDRMEVPDVDILQSDERKNWVNFDKFEADKFQWMQNVPKNIPKLKPGETFEARFDWKGILLPYVEKDENSTDNRELYLHGEDPFRPGYTIQELFRLARSNVMQQRIQALGAIAGIVRIYNQGFYDEISDLPISKIFFLLRFALDDSTASVAEAALVGLSALLYNEIDELLLDTVFETQLGIVQPVTRGTESADLEKNFSKLKLNSSDMDEDMSNIEQMNDFHLAEVDLLKCLMRTNILKRIHYLLANEMVSGTGVVALTRILIRICREGRGFVREMLDHHEILTALRTSYLTELPRIPMDSGKVQATILKLFRVIVATENSWAILQKFDMKDVLLEYCCNRRDLTADFIQLQLESFRLLRVWLTFDPLKPRISDFVDAIQTNLEWNFQFMPFTDGSQLMRHHAAVLLATLNHPTFEWTPQRFSQLSHCLKKWTALFTQSKTSDFSHNILLTTCFELVLQQSPQVVEEFMLDYFQKFLISDKHINLWRDLIATSSLIHPHRDRSKAFEALSNLGGVAFKEHSDEPQLQLPFNFPGTVLLSVVEVCRKFGKGVTLKWNVQKNVEEYFTNIVDAKLKNEVNWYCRHEIQLLLVLLKMDLCDKDLTLKTAMKVLKLLKGEENISNVKDLFINIIFNSHFYSSSAVTQIDHFLWNIVYWKFYSLNFGELEITSKFPLSSSNWKKNLLPDNWPLAMLTIFLEQHTSETMPLFVINPQVQDEILTASLGFLGLLEENCLIPVTPSEEYMFLMMPFLSIECRFLESAIKERLGNRISSLFARSPTFKFTLKLQEKHDFESIYTIFLNQFQSSSYGDDLFSAMVLVPLAQKYDAKWRKMVWSEHIAVLRFITCSEDQLCGGSIQPYLEPHEKDTSVLKLYNQALNSNCLRKESIPYRIAEHHLKCKRDS
ncbi:RNA polymerase II-associated protein 1 [Phlebotomus argentipes]|uniref:RNA polymerase II-associated protein 1 n=1 Tax=Phlebotomus argentipes TaxID=94469 RepID=UPI002892C4A4|nr:RNA polymerase II-associated protein 1 [Phlebotomus argentipes]